MKPFVDLGGQRKTGKPLPHSALSGNGDVSASLHVSSTLRMDRLWSGFGFRSREQKVAKSFSIAVVLSGSYVPAVFRSLELYGTWRGADIDSSLIETYVGPSHL